MANILVVDDEVLISEFIGKVLRVEGHKATSRSDIRDGILGLQKETFDLVIIDYWAGWEEIRPYLFPITETKALVITGDIQIQLSEVPVLYKPFTIEELFEAVGRLLSRSDV